MDKKMIKEFLKPTKKKVIVFLGLIIIPSLIHLIELLLLSPNAAISFLYSYDYKDLLFFHIFFGSMFFGGSYCSPACGWINIGLQEISGIILYFFLLYSLSCLIVYSYNKFKEFLRPTKKKILLLIIIGLILFNVPYNYEYSNMFGIESVESHGFPIPFHDKQSCYIYESKHESKHFYLGALLLDIMIWYVLSCLIISIHTKLNFKKEENMENQINPNKKPIPVIAIIIGILAIGAVGFIAWQYFEKVSDNNVLEENKGSKLPEEEKTKKEEIIPSEKINEIADWKIYRNEEYGFEITLIDSWKGFSAITESWQGTTLNGNSIEFQGPKILLRNPNWTNVKPYWQDIPILIFTKQGWQLIEAKNLSIFAAPIGPIKLGENQQYVFALPPRWVGFSDTLGQNEAKQIAETFKAFQIKDETADWKIYRNEEYGFEVKYPEIFELSDTGTGIYYEPTNSRKIIEIGFCLNCNMSFDNGVNLGIFYSDDQFKYPDLDNLLEKEKKSVAVDAFTVKKYTYGDFEGIKIEGTQYQNQIGEDHLKLFLKTKFGFYSLFWHATDPEQKGFNYETYLIPILSTFKFIETDKTADWKTYKKDIFTLKYPSEIWNLKDERLFHKKIGDSCAIIPGGLWRQSLIKIVESTDTIFNGYEARQVKLGNENDVSIINVYFDENLPGKEFRISLPKDKQDKQICENDFKEIISTIEFEKLN